MTWDDYRMWKLAQQVMTPAQYHAVYLHFADELAVKDIATDLKVTPQAVRDRINSGLKRLADAYKEQEAA